MREGVFNRRLFSLSAALAAFTWARSAASIEARVGKTKVTLAVSGKAAFYYLPLTVAEQLGYFEQEGIEMEIIDFQSVLKAQQALATGTVDAVCGAFDHVINLHSKNQFVQSFVALGRAPQMAMGVSIKNMPNYKNGMDLKGKKIGISAPGSSSNMMAYLVLQRAGLPPSEVSFIGVGTAAGAIAAVRSGQIDAVCNFEPVMTMLEQKGDIKIISDARTLKGTRALYGSLMPAACLYAPSDFLYKNRAVTQALTNAVVRSLKWLRTAGPRDLIKVVPEAYLLGDRSLYLASYNNLRESFSLNGMIADEEAKAALRHLSNFDPTMKADKIELAKTFTNAYAKRAKSIFRA